MGTPNKSAQPEQPSPQPEPDGDFQFPHREDRSSGGESTPPSDQPQPDSVTRERRRSI